MAVSEVTISTILVKVEGKIQKPIFYISRILKEVETRYIPLERLALALVMASRRLKPYFKVHMIKVLIDQPLKKVMQRPEISGRLMAWVVKLGAFDIQYLPRVNMIEQVVVDFIVEMTPTPDKHSQSDPFM